MKGLVYTASFDGIAKTAAGDFIEIAAPADAAVVLIGGHLGQSLDFGDAAAEMLRISLARAATSGSGGTTATARPHQVGFPASGSVCETNNTTPAGTKTIVKPFTFNIQAGWDYIPIPEDWLYLSPSGILVLDLISTPADSLTFSGWLTFMEIGG